MVRITLWDRDAARIAEIEKNIKGAFNELKIKGEIIIMSEPPLLARTGIIHRVPVLEINGLQYSLKAGETMPQRDIVDLLAALKLS